MSAFSTCELYRHLVMQSSGMTGPESLLRAAAEHLHVHGTADSSALGLLRDLAENHGTPPDVLAAFVSHPDPVVRRLVLSNANLEPEVRLRALRGERSAVVLRHLAERSSDPAVLTDLAGRRYRGNLHTQIVTALLGNDSLPLAAACDLVLFAQEQLVGTADPDEKLRDAALSALNDFAGLAQVVVAHLTWRPLLVSAARGDLDVAGWEHLERKLVDGALMGLGDGEALGHEHRSACETLLDSGKVPLRLRRRVAELILERNPKWTRSATIARRLLATPEPSADAADDTRELLLVATSDDVAKLQLLLARPRLPSHVAWRVALNPASPPDVACLAVRRTEPPERDLGALFAVHADIEMRGQLCWELGPATLEAVPDADRAQVLEAALERVLLSGSRTRHPWMPLVANLDDDALAALPWGLVRALAIEFAPIGARLTAWLEVMLAAPGAGRIFATIDTTFDGSAGDLIAAVGAATSAPTVRGLTG